MPELEIDVTRVKVAQSLNPAALLVVPGLIAAQEPRTAWMAYCLGGLFLLLCLRACVAALSPRTKVVVSSAGIRADGWSVRWDELSKTEIQLERGCLPLLRVIPGPRVVLVLRTRAGVGLARRHPALAAYGVTSGTWRIPVGDTHAVEQRLRAACRYLGPERLTGPRVDLNHRPERIRMTLTLCAVAWGTWWPAMVTPDFRMDLYVLWISAPLWSAVVARGGAWISRYGSWVIAGYAIVSLVAFLEGISLLLCLAYTFLFIAAGMPARADVRDWLEARLCERALERAGSTSRS